MEQAKMNSCQIDIYDNVQLNMKTYLPSVQEVWGKVLNLFILTLFISSFIFIYYLYMYLFISTFHQNND